MGHHVPTRIDVSQGTALILLVAIVALVVFIGFVVRRGMK
jgi:hypothetical protein